MPVADRNPSSSVPYVVTVDFGSSQPTAPMLAITSWAKLLMAIETELVDEPHHRNDLHQLRALCEAADDDTSAPLSSTELTNQRAPSLILQLGSIVQRAVSLGVSEGVLSVDGLRPMASWERIGRYLRLPPGTGVGAWFGTDFRRWRERGSTPLWLVFSATDFGRALEVRSVLSPWAERKGLDRSLQGDEFGVGINLVPGEEQEQVIRSIVNQLRSLASELTSLTAGDETAP